MKIIRFDSVGSSQWPLPLLSSWLATFPTLKQVSFAKDCLPSDPEAQRKDSKQVMKEACPFLEVIGVDGIEAELGSLCETLSINVVSNTS